MVTYPKCRTTWVQQIMCLIKNNGIPHKSGEQFIFKSFIDFREKDFLNYRIIKSHLVLELIPYNKFAKYLYVIRNPKDVCVSFYDHTKGRGQYQWTKHFHYFNIWIEREIAYGDYFEHILSFWSHKFDDNLIF